MQSSSRILAKKSQEDIEAKLQNLLKKPDFLRDLDKLKVLIAQGLSLDEARLQYPPMKYSRWHLMLAAIGQCTYTPGKLYMEYYIRSKMRYSMLIDIYNKATDQKTKMMAVMNMIRIDESRVNIAQSLGVLVPEEKTIDGGIGIDNADLREKYAELEREIGSRLRDDQLSKLRVTAVLLTQPQPERPEIDVGPTPVDANTSK